MVRKESKTGTREMGQFASYRALDLLPPLFQVACRLHASSLSFSSELVRGVLVHAHANSEAEKREEPSRAAVFRSSLPEGVREGEWKRIHCTSRSTVTWFFAWRLTSPTGRIKRYIKTLFYTNFLWGAELYLAFRRLKVDVQAWNLTSTTLLSSARFTVGWHQLKEIDLQDKPQVSEISSPFRWMPQLHTGIVILTDLITIMLLVGIEDVQGLAVCHPQF